MGLDERNYSGDTVISSMRDKLFYISLIILKCKILITLILKQRISHRNLSSNLPFFLFRHTQFSILIIVGST